MIDFAAVRIALNSWFAAGTGVQIIVENEQRPFVESRYIAWAFSSVGGAALDDVSQVFVTVGTPPDDIEVAVSRVSGQRPFTVEVESYSHSQAPADFAPVALERLRTLASTPRLRAILATAGVALASFGPSTVRDIPQDERQFSVWGATLEFSVAFTFTADSGVEANRESAIETVNGEAEVPDESTPREFSVTSVSEEP